MDEGRERLKSNDYPGRGIVIGLDETGSYLLQLYFITARSAGSKNRVLVIEDGDVRTQPFDESARTEDPNVYYRAITAAGDRHIVTNGDHTDVIAHYLARGENFAAAMQTTSYETDAPNFTPRIAGLADLAGERLHVQFGMASRGPTGKAFHNLYSYLPSSAAGHCLHTYAANGNPVKPYTGRPYEIELRGSPEEVAAGLWELLPADKRVALALKAVEIESKRVVRLTVRNTLEFEAPS